MVYIHTNPDEEVNVGGKQSCDIETLAVMLEASLDQSDVFSELPIHFGLDARECSGVGEICRCGAVYLIKFVSLRQTMGVLVYGLLEIAEHARATIAVW